MSIDGTNGRDTLRGGPGADTIRGFGGRDDLAGRGGDDDVRGGKGRDDVRGNADEDVVRGGPGRDNVSGGQGADDLFGGKGNDRFVFDDRDSGRAPGNISDFDTVHGFREGDKIDLRPLDGRPDFAGLNVFPVDTGEFSIFRSGGDSFVVWDTPSSGGDRAIFVPDFTLQLNDVLV